MDRSDQSPEPEVAPALRDFRAALIGVTDAMQGNVSRAGAMFRKVGQLEAAMDAGRPLVEVVRSEARPLVVEMLTENIAALQTAGLELRRTEARALYAHGMTMPQIAAHFGVSRQRISALMRDD